MELVSPNPGTIFWMVIIFGIVMMILKDFAWKPILRALKERELNIHGALRAAEKARKEVADLKADHEALRVQANREKEEILKEATRIRDRIMAEAREQARLEIQKSVETARELIQNERKAALDDIKKQVAEMSVLIAEKILREKLSTDLEQEKTIHTMLDNLTMN